MDIVVERDSPVVQDMTADAEEDVSEALRDLARWLYGRLDDEYEHLTSDAAIDEMIRLNEYGFTADGVRRSEEHTSELQSLMRTSYSVFCLKKKTNNRQLQQTN